MKPEVSDFEQQEHSPYTYHERHGDDWKLDFTTIPPRRYKDLHGYAWVYEGGMVELKRVPHGGHRAAEMRDELERKYGFRFSLLRSEAPDTQFFTPDREPIPKCAVTADWLLFDKNHKMAMSMAWRRGYHESIRYYAPGARPSGGSPISLTVPDYKATRALRNKLAPLVMLVTSYMAVAENLGTGNIVGAKSYIDNVHKGQCNPSDIVDNPPSVKLLEGFASLLSRKQLNDEIYQLCCTPVEVPFLYFEEKK